ncbi:DUF1801 domain-containing protein [Nocardia sp. SYP-A9097]|uniref:iron chaperone n=1 Tax=Nocardia sp. SYP-A9097 TaxID=2663237 RepID=UPI00129B8355|nr:DUF1801 domain-containing protein [Nocardia sp. SYP-A9097]MRH90155.1 DUF1801 domain-containing protein [Nocardia sp. SYP-A9097]
MVASTVDEYIAGFPADVRQVLEQVRETIHGVLPDGTETISYEVPTVRVGAKAVVYFAGWNKHISVYPVPAGDADYIQAIAPYQAGKGTLKFLLDKPIPYELIGRTAALLAAQRGGH